MDIEKKISPESYGKKVKKKSPKSNVLLDCIRAFLIGGGICTVGQTLKWLAAEVFLWNEQTTAAFVSVTLIFIGSLLTGLGVYDVLGKFAGAGSIVPITGFANSIVSPAMEYRREGFVMGVGAKLFSVAGPVLVYGITASVVIGFLYIGLTALGLIS